MHVKTKDNEHNIIEKKGLEMVLKCDKKSKEQRIRHVIKNRLENTSEVGNAVLQYGKN